MKTVAIVSPGACIRTHKFASIVNNFVKILVTAEDVDPSQARHYDDILRPHIFDPSLIVDLGADLIHYHNEPNEPAYYLLKGVPQIPLIFDCHDMVSFARDADDPYEKYIFEAAAGVIHVNDALQERAKKMYKMRNTAVFSNYVSAQYMSNPLKDRTGTIVYQGGFTNHPESHRNLAPFFKTFASLGFEVDIYSSWQVNSVGFGQNITVHPSLPYDQLMKKLQEYRFGFIGFNHAGQDYKTDFLDTALPNKFFEYLAAGLPVIVYKAALVEEIVREKGIGVVLEKPEDIVLLRAVDYEQLVDNVIEARSSFILEEQGERLERFYNKVLPGARVFEKVGRNEPCPCGSGKKYKKCCG